MTGSTTRAGSTFGRYQIRELLGRGGMGEVYEAYDTVKERVVALKILSAQHFSDETFRERFRRESHAAAGLQEPHIVPIHDWGDVDGTLYIDMRRVNGVDLGTALKDGPLVPARAVAIIGQVAAALDAAHGTGLVHRDVKPGNIIVTPADFAYLVDFGIAEAVGDTRLTTAGTAVGSFAYMAPERFGDHPVTPAADVYSLACVLYEMLVGSVPYLSTNVPQLIAAHISTPPPPPSATNRAVSVAFDAVIGRGMAKEPTDRYPSAAAFAAAAQRALGSAPAYPVLDDAIVDAWSASSAPTALGTRTAPVTSPRRPAPVPAGGPPTTPAVPRRGMLLPVLAAVAAIVITGSGVGAGILFVQRNRHRAESPSTALSSAPAAQPVVLPPGARVCPPRFGRTGAYATSAAGTSVTSCEFAEAVRDVLGSSPPVGSTPEVVRAYSSVTGKWYPMTCVANGPLTTCTGGNDAIVYAY